MAKTSLQTLCTAVARLPGVGYRLSCLSLSLNISKTVAEQTQLKLQLMTNMKSDMGFPLTPKSMTLDDLELL